MTPLEVLQNNLRQIILSCKQHGESEAAFAGRISSAVNEVGLITRRKLRSIIHKETEGEAHSISLSLSELWAIHTFLHQNQRGGIEAVLGARPLLSSLAARGKVVFILPCKRVLDTKAVIEWDLRAMMEIVEKLRRINPTMQVMIDVLQPCEGNELETGETWSSFFKRQGWYKKYVTPPETEAPSLVCIGSPRANHATELILSSMYGREPFTPTETSATLPFRFYWQPESRLPSSFTATKGDYRTCVGDWGKYEGEDKKVSALLVRKTGNNPKGFPVAYAAESRRWSTYGIIAAHRHNDGPLWIVAAGLKAPGSLGAARVLTDLNPLLVDDPVEPSMTKQFFLEYRVERKTNSDATGQESRDLKDCLDLWEIPQ